MQIKGVLSIHKVLTDGIAAKARIVGSVIFVAVATERSASNGRVTERRQIVLKIIKSNTNAISCGENKFLKYKYRVEPGCLPEYLNTFHFCKNQKHSPKRREKK